DQQAGSQAETEPSSRILADAPLSHPGLRPSRLLIECPGRGADPFPPDRDVHVDRRPHFLRARAPRTRPLLSVVVPLFNEQETVAALWGRLHAVLEQLGAPAEVVLVDDGSQDRTPRWIDALHERDERVVVVRLSRNFGHQAAISAGLAHARGRAVVVMDGDLQDPPELIPEFLQLWRAGNDVVYAVRRSRREGPWL